MVYVYVREGTGDRILLYQILVVRIRGSYWMQIQRMHRISAIVIPRMIISAECAGQPVT